MKQGILRLFLTGSFLLLAMALLPLSAAAATPAPWQWQQGLLLDEAGESMYMPSAVAFDRESERYYVVDTGRSRLVSFDKEGKVIRAFTANDQLKSPFDLVRMDNGRMWVVEKGRNSLTLIDLANRKVEPNTLKDGERLVFPDRIAVSEGKLHILDRSSGMVLRLNDDLSVDRRFGCPDCSGGLIDFVFQDDSILGIESGGKRILRFDSDGTIADKMELGDEVDFPVSLDVGPSGYIYVLDRHQNKVFTYTRSGQFRYSFLGTGKAPGKVYFPRQLRFDPWGRLCVVDEGNGRVEIFSR